LYASALAVPRFWIAFFSSGSSFQLERRNDRLRDFVLQRENVVEVAVVALGPDVAASRAIDKLSSDPDTAARFAHAAFEQVAHLELPRDLRRIDVLALEREGGVARGDPERRDLGKVGDDVLADAVGEVLLLRIAAHVGEREDADRHAALRFRLAVVVRRIVRRAQHEDVHRTHDVLDVMLAQVFEGARDLARHVIANRRRHGDAAHGGHRLQARGDVDAFAIDVVAFDDDIAQIDANAVAQRFRVDMLPIAAPSPFGWPVRIRRPQPRCRIRPVHRHP
jgi:hypothetical protein